MCAISNKIVEAKVRFAAHGGASVITCIFFSGNSLKYAIIFAQKGTSNTLKGV